jgi:hypothetical protein
MKPDLYRNILILACAGFAIIPACSITSSSAPSLQATADSGSAVPTRNGQARSGLGLIGYTLDDGRKASGSFDINAGKPLTLNVDDANGYSWMLWILADALMSNETITIAEGGFTGSGKIHIVLKHTPQ